MAISTVQDLLDAAGALTTSITDYRDKKQAANTDRAAADAADGLAAASEHTSDTAEQAMFDAHEVFDTVLDQFRHPTPPVPPPA